MDDVKRLAVCSTSSVVALRIARVDCRTTRRSSGRGQAAAAERLRRWVDGSLVRG